MNPDLVWRYVRQRRILGLIFFSSLLYFLIKTDLLPLSSLFDRQKVDRKQDDSKYFRAQLLRLPKSIDWHTSDTFKNETDFKIGVRKCRYTKQGKRWVVDDLGFLCERHKLTPSGCCPSSPAARFVCANCDTVSTHCCSSYEHCVSCCLKPSHRPLLETVIKATNGNRLRGLLMVKDHYQLCEWKCRTSSNSVYQENKYKNPKAKYCYGLEPKLPFTR